MGEKIIRDPVWGDLVLSTDTEMRLVDTPEFQRLRGIKQLGTASLVYPGALHTRFDHSLGTAHVTGRVLDALERSGSVRITPRERIAARVAALLHDVTHIPFGHTFEDERRIFDRHDTPQRTEYFLGQGELGRRLKRLGLAEEVLDLLTRRGDPERAFLHEAISGTVCADLLDYLARDAYHCGIAARWDERLFRTFVVENGRLAVNAEKRGIVREDALTEVVNLLRIRYTLSERVYFHHAKVAAGAMVSKVVERAVAAGLELEELFGLRDEGLFATLAARFADDRVLTRLINLIHARWLHKRAYVLTTQVTAERRRELIALYHHDRARRERDEAMLEQDLGLDPGDVIIYCPSERMQLKEAKVPVRLGDGISRPLGELGLREISVLHEKHRELWKLYVLVAAERRDRAADLSRACEQLLGEPNQLDLVRSGQLSFGFGG